MDDNKTEVTLESTDSLKDRFKLLFIKMLSLKFGSFMIQITLGIIWFIQLLKTEIGNAAVWGIWSGYMVGAFTVYTAGNVQTKKVTNLVTPLTELVKGAE